MSDMFASDSSCENIRDDIGVPRVTFICSELSTTSIVISSDSKLSWTDGRPDQIVDKVFPLGNHAISIAGSYGALKPILDEILARPAEIRDDVFEAQNDVERLAKTAFRKFHGNDKYKSHEYYSFDFGLYGYGKGMTGSRIPAQIELRADTGFMPRYHNRKVFALGKPQCEKAVADFIIEKRASWMERDLAGVLHYAVERTIRRAPVFVGPPIRTFAISDGSAMRELTSIPEIQSSVAAYDAWLSKSAP